MTDRPSAPGWYPDPWQPGGWRWHDGNEWTSWTGPPPGPPPTMAAPAAAWGAPSATEDQASEDRLRPWAVLAVVAMPLTQLGLVLAFSFAVRDWMGDLFDVVFDEDATQADVDRAVDDALDAAANSEATLLLNVVGWLPVGALALLAVWANRVAHVARRLGYPARRSPGWAAAGWFVPIVNLWFPYQSLADSLEPGSDRRGRVLAWWLAFVLGSIAAPILVVVVVVADAGGVPAAVTAAAVLAVLQAALGVRAVEAVHADHRDALSRR